MNKVTIYHGDDVIHTHNRICAGFENWRRSKIKTIILNNFAGRERYPVLDSTSYPFAICLLLTEAGSNAYPVGELIASADVGVSSSLSQDRGSLNREESFSTNRKMHLVFDFGTQVTGTIKGIVFSSSSSSSSSLEGANQVQGNVTKKYSGTIEENGSIQNGYYYFTRNKKIYRIHIEKDGEIEEVCTVNQKASTRDRIFRMTDESFVIFEGNQAHKISRDGQFLETITIGNKRSIRGCAHLDGTFYSFGENVIRHYSAAGVEIEEDQMILNKEKIKGNSWGEAMIDVKDNAFIIGSPTSYQGFLYFTKGKPPAMSSCLPRSTNLLGLAKKNVVAVRIENYLGKVSTDAIMSAIDLETPIVKDNTKTLKIVYDLNFDSLF